MQNLDKILNRNTGSKRTRRLSALLLAIALVLTATACSSVAAETRQAAGPAASASATNAAGSAATVAGSTAAAAGSAAAGGPAIKVRVAHTQTYVPYDYVNDKGESDGFEVQVLKAVDELLPQYTFEFVPTSDDDLLIGIESGKYNLGTKGAWFTSERARKYVFPKKYIAASIIGITFRTADADKIKDLESFARFSGKLVPIAPQNAQWTIVEDFNKKNPANPVKLVAAESFNNADAYAWVLEGRYDAYFDIKLSFENNVKSPKGPYNNLADKLSYLPYRAIPTWPLFNKKDQSLADAYDGAIEQLTQSGRIAELSQKYFNENIFQYIKE